MTNLTTIVNEKFGSAQYDENKNKSTNKILASSTKIYWTIRDGNETRSISSQIIITNTSDSGSTAIQKKSVLEKSEKKTALPSKRSWKLAAKPYAEPLAIPRAFDSSSSNSKNLSTKNAIQYSKRFKPLNFVPKSPVKKDAKKKRLFTSSKRRRKNKLLKKFKKRLPLQILFYPYDNNLLEATLSRYAFKSERATRRNNETVKVAADGTTKKKSCHTTAKSSQTSAVAVTVRPTTKAIDPMTNLSENFKTPNVSETVKKPISLETVKKISKVDVIPKSSKSPKVDTVLKKIRKNEVRLTPEKETLDYSTSTIATDTVRLNNTSTEETGLNRSTKEQLLEDSKLLQEKPINKSGTENSKNNAKKLQPTSSNKSAEYTNQETKGYD